MIGRIVLISLLTLVGVFGVYEWQLRRSADVLLARTSAVNVLVSCAAFYLFAARKTFDPAIARRAILGIRPALLSVLVITLLQLAFTYLPPMQVVFGTRPLDFIAWLVIVGCGLVPFLAAEVEKAVWRLRGSDRTPSLRKAHV